MKKACYEKNGKCFRQRVTFFLRVTVIVLTAVYFSVCFFMRLTVRDASLADEECMLYYIVNADGMKGLGHSMILLVDGNGCGTAVSFNGMQRTLGESLSGKSGVGKLSMGIMTREETESFLQTGDLDLKEDQLKDNYDMALYRTITTEEYQAILQETAPYVELEEQFTILYAKWAAEKNVEKRKEYKEMMERLGQDESEPLYQIYRHNCDHTARELISTIDQDMRDYVQHVWRMTPSGNWKAFGRQAKDWGVRELGNQSLREEY